ncbi:MAG: FecR family protein [Bacteroidota bacterium]
MKKEDLIVKWLDNNLNEEELRAFKELDAYSAFMKLDQAAQQFKAPDFDLDANLAKLKDQKPSAKPVFAWKQYVAGVAAALVLFLGVYLSFFNTTDTDTTFLAQNGETKEFILPDRSEVVLNAGSNISYESEDWGQNRNLNLEGEAYFKVAKGSKFTVHTDQGTVSVLGTQFKVKAREHFFEVVCYEGMVQVEHHGKMTKLPGGSSIKMFENNRLGKTLVTDTEPSWLHRKSSFISVPYQEVIDELQRQYNIAIAPLDSVTNDTLFTGSFTHENLETALEAITIPLNLSYKIEGNNVVLKSN